MGTRSLIHFDEDGTTLATLYRQFDGYPEVAGLALAGVLTRNGKSRKVVNGFGGGDGASGAFNTLGCVAAEVIGRLKLENREDDGSTIGGFYVYKPGSKDCGEEYTYTVSVKDGEPWVEAVDVLADDGALFAGDAAAFLKFCQAAADSD